MKCIKIHKDDSVAVAVETLKQGEIVTINDEKITLLNNVPAGHKFALKDIPIDENIVKYAYPIGHAKCDIKKGEHIHTHNTKSNLSGVLEYEYSPDFKEVKKIKPLKFMGYKRPDGKVGIRNEIWIIPTVGCVNSIVREIENQSQQFKTENIDGIYSYNHPYGCSQLGDDMNMTLKFLSGLINHPNAAAVLVVGLGCENGNIDELKKVLGNYDENRVKFLVAQDFEDEITEGVNIIEKLSKYADIYKREDCPASELVIGLKCGGSDGFSGITANPLLGSLSDRIIGMGGSAILTEVPEMFGAETILMNRCRTENEFNKTVDLINNFKKYFMRYGEKVDENPSPGNKEGGITTLEDKALGCTQKCGTAPVEDVLSYGECVKKKGLSLLQAPGNDLVAANALAVSGAQLILFTTGRGTPFGCPVPTAKISSNSALATKKKMWIDFNAGTLLENKSMPELTNEFLDFVLKLASGESTAKAESLDKHELAIFKDGVTL
ncbi:MAG: altronate dehydratase family protein [Oscillospiraceae bacterium]|nr:altronate dehydratase family protein [Oscillospiraceae bacterium]